jgi:hypothetical protein
MASRGIHGSRPATAWEDAYPTGNGRHGAIVYGDPYGETVIVTHHTPVAPDGSAGARPPGLVDRLEEVRGLIRAREPENIQQLSRDSRDVPM